MPKFSDEEYRSIEEIRLAIFEGGKILRSVVSILVVYFALVSLTGCPFSSYRATLDPTLHVAPSAIGAGQPVRVMVVDERPRKMIGRRGTGISGGTITIDQDLSEVIRQELEEGLMQYNFAMATGDERDPRTMKVEIRAFEYELVMGFFTGSAQTTAALKVIGRNSNETYEKLYRAEHKRGTFFVPTGAKTNRMLDETLTELLGKVLRDQELFRFLAM
jgi:uncharacterized lipoprotein YajG